MDYGYSKSLPFSQRNSAGPKYIWPCRVYRRDYFGGTPGGDECHLGLPNFSAKTVAT